MVATAPPGVREAAARASYTRPARGLNPPIRYCRPLGVPTLTIPFAALAALLAALLETSVTSEIPIAGATADLVLVCAIAAVLAMGVIDGLVAAFLGGLLVDLLVPGRPLGAATFTLVLMTGLAAASGSILGSNRRLSLAALAFALTVAYEIVLTLVLVLTENAPLSMSPGSIIVAGVMSAILVVPIAAIFSLLERRFGPAERAPW